MRIKTWLLYFLKYFGNGLRKKVQLKFFLENIIKCLKEAYKESKITYNIISVAIHFNRHSAKPISQYDASLAQHRTRVANTLVSRHNIIFMASKYEEDIYIHWQGHIGYDILANTSIYWRSCRYYAGLFVLIYV